MLNNEIYKNNGIYLGKNLLGKILVYNNGSSIFKGKIVETESYMGIIDKASHAYNGKRTNRTETMYKEGGVLYIYFIYGMHYCVNVVANEIGIPEAVLIRALEPISPLDKISFNRFGKSYNELTKKERINLTNGPSKLAKAFSIDKSLDGESLLNGKIYIEDNDEEFEIVETKRIGIDYAEEARDFLYRYYIKDNSYVSKK